MKFITVIIWSVEEKDIAIHDSLQAAEQYLNKWYLAGSYGKDYFIAVMVEQQYVIPDLQSVVKQ